MASTAGDSSSLLCPVCDAPLLGLDPAARQSHVASCIRRRELAEAAHAASLAAAQAASQDREHINKAYHMLHSVRVPGTQLSLSQVVIPGGAPRDAGGPPPHLLEAGCAGSTVPMGGIALSPQGPGVAAAMQALQAAYNTRPKDCTPVGLASLRLRSDPLHSRVLRGAYATDMVDDKVFASALRRGRAVEFLWEGVPMWGTVVSAIGRSSGGLAPLTVTAHSSGVQLDLNTRQVRGIVGGGHESLAHDAACETESALRHFWKDEEGGKGGVKGMDLASAAAESGTAAAEAGAMHHTAAVSAAVLAPSTSGTSGGSRAGEGGDDVHSGASKGSDSGSGSKSAGTSSKGVKGGSTGAGRRGSGGESLHDARVATSLRVRRKFVPGKSLRWDLRVYFCDRLDELALEWAHVSVPGTAAPAMFAGMGWQRSVDAAADMTVCAVRWRILQYSVPMGAVRSLLHSHVPHWRWLRGGASPPIPPRCPPLPGSCWQDLAHSTALTCSPVWSTLPLDVVQQEGLAAEFEGKVSLASAATGLRVAVLTQQ